MRRTTAWMLLAAASGAAGSLPGTTMRCVSTQHCVARTEAAELALNSFSFLSRIANLSRRSSTIAWQRQDLHQDGTSHSKRERKRKIPAAAVVHCLACLLRCLAQHLRLEALFEFPRSTRQSTRTGQTRLPSFGALRSDDLHCLSIAAYSSNHFQLCYKWISFVGFCSQLLGCWLR